MSDLNNNLNGGLQEIASGADSVKKKKPIAIIIAAAVLVIVLAGILLYAFVPAVKNSVKLALMKPENYFAYVEKDNMGKSAKELSDNYGAVIDKFNQNNGVASNYTVSAEINPDIAAQYNLGDISKIAFSGNVTLKDNNSSLNAAVSANDQNLVSANMLIDYAMSEIYINIPELSDAFLKSSFDTSSLDSMDSYTDDYTSTSILDSVSSSKFISNPETMYNGEVLSAEELEKLINKYYGIVIDNIDDIEIEKNAEVSIDNVSTKYTQITATIDADCAKDITNDILEAAKDDDVIKEIASEWYGIDEEDFESYIDEALTNVEENFDDTSDNEIKLITDVDTTGTIRGRSILAYEDGELVDDFNFSYILLKEDDDIAGNISFIYDDTEINVDLDLTEKSDTYNGTAKLTISDETSDYTVNFDIADFKIVDKTLGYVDGTISITSDIEELSSFDKLEFVLSSDGKQQDLSFDLAVAGTEYGTLNINYSDVAPEDVTIPSEDSDTIYDMNSQDDMAEFMENADIDALISDISDKIGIDLSSLLSQYTGTGYGDNYDDYDDDDYTSDDYDQYTSSADYTYDFSKLHYDINGTPVALPSPLSNAADLLSMDANTTIAANDYDAFYSADQTFALGFSNNTMADLPIGSCTLDELYLFQENSMFNLSINNVKIGSSVTDIASAFGITPNANESEIKIYSNDDEYHYVTFGITNNKVSSIEVALY